jgi:hypothetical protein
LRASTRAESNARPDHFFREEISRPSTPERLYFSGENAVRAARDTRIDRANRK